MGAEPRIGLLTAPGDGARWQWDGGSVQTELGVVWRPPTNGAGVEWRVDVQRSGALAAAWTYSVVRDPLILSAGLAAETERSGAVPSIRFGSSAGVALVANDKVSLRAAFSHWFPTTVDALPQTNVGVGVSYALEPRYTRRVSFETVLHMRGWETFVGFWRHVFRRRARKVKNVYNHSATTWKPLSTYDKAVEGDFSE